MKREARLLRSKACDSLVLSIEFFNRPHDRGRVSSTLILLDHAFEMLLKAAVVHRGGKIREKPSKETIGFDACVRRALSDGNIQFLTEEQTLVLQTINGLRDAAQHHLLDISESQLYLHAQSGVTLFRDLMKKVFDEDLVLYLPERVLPVSTSPPCDLATLFESEVREITKLLQPGRRRRLEVEARLRPLTILDATLKGEKRQPSERELRRIGRQLLRGKSWQDIFHGVSAVEISAEGAGPALSLRLSKKEGIPTQLVPEGTPGASVVAVRRVNELDFYNLGANALAGNLGITVPKTVALVRHLGLQNDPDYFKEFIIGSQRYKRYSQRALAAITEAMQQPGFNLDAIWREHGHPRRPSRAS